MAFDGFITKAIIKELNTKILFSKVNKISEPDKNTIIFDLYSDYKNYLLELSIHPENCRIDLTEHSKPNPYTAPNFCMLLRKHLLGAKIISIEMEDLERIVYITFEHYNEYGENSIKKIIIEVMGRYSNIILVNSQNIIIDTLKHTYSFRNLIPQKTYEPPISTKASLYDVNNFNDFFNILLSNNFSVEKAFIGFSKTYSNFLITKLQINFSEKESIKRLYNFLLKILNFEDIYCVNYNNNDYVLDINENNKNFSINSFIDNFYFLKESNEQFISLRNKLLKIILSVLKKYEKRLDNINNKLKETENMDLYKLYGELIISNLYKFSNNVNSITVENYYDNNNIITIPLDISISPHKNADKYFKKYNKLKNTVLIVSNQKVETENDLYYIESIIFSLENSQTIEDLNDIFIELSTSSLFKDYFKIKDTKNKRKESKNLPIEHNIDGYTVFVRKK